MAKLPRVFVHDHLKLELKSGPKPPQREYQRLHSTDGNQIRKACQSWGFFHVLNHGIPVTTLEETINGIRRFHERDPAAKRVVYPVTNPRKSLSSFNTKTDMSQATAYWRDTTRPVKNCLKLAGNVMGLYVMGHYYLHALNQKSPWV
ncbi:hypothetical protein COLO4_15850 [Corchorus olitorius]|uniref:Non-haem dioxygenase N-terminal domain-containing protein n=1 Tax=Corchorus olitorius TaxID=93759 RepID=A0A1R3JL49_9ROSI|nr:hypothetical protein COLO4_15850 [Corchorus olitorius]